MLCSASACRAARLFLLSLLVGLMALPAAVVGAQDGEPADTRSRTETVGSLKCHVIRPVDAEGNDLPPTGLLLGLPGPGVAADSFNRVLSRAFGRPGEVVATPEMTLEDEAQFNAFRATGSTGEQEAEDAAAVARVLTVRAIQFLKQQKLWTGHVRVVAALGGANTAMQLLAGGQLTADEVSLVLPAPFDLPWLASPLDEDGDGDETPAAPAVGHGRRWPVFDVYLDRLPPYELADAEGAVREALGPAAATARFYSAPRGARSLGEYLSAAAAIHRPVIIDTERNIGMTLSQLVKALEKYDVIFYGEQHDSIATQEIEAEVFRRLHQMDNRTALSMEMFERDVQNVLDRYLAGDITEAGFLAGSRPWPNYASGYRAMIEYAREVTAPVIAANIPRSLAREISRGGVEAVAELDVQQRSYIARELHTEPQGAYFREFRKAMGAMAGHGGGNGGGPTLESMFAAQCAKDDTMAEAIADFRAGNPGRRVVHINGRFHSDHGLGTVERLLMRAPDTRVAIITTEAVDNPTRATANDVEPGVARFVVFVPANRPGRR